MPLHCLLHKTNLLQSLPGSRSFCFVLFLPVSVSAPMKVLLLLILAAAVVARPEVGTDRKAEEQKEVQQLPSAPLPTKEMQSLAPEMVMYMPEFQLQPAEIARRRPLQNMVQRPPRPLLQGYLAAIQSFPALQNIPALLPIQLSPPLLPNPFTRNYEEDIADYVARIEDSLGAEDSSVVLASSDDQHTSLILKPVAKAVAGPRGVAVASPIAKAVLRRGQPAQVEFDPDAVAIAGPGGEAHAQPKLIISYANDTKTDD